MWILALSVVTVVVIYAFHWLNNPKFSNGSSFPPGSMGFPFIGETLQLMIPSYSLDVHPFIRKRIQRFGLIFRTSLFGQPVVISADPEFNSYLVQQEGRLVEMWLGPLSKAFLPCDGDSRLLEGGYMHKYIRSITLSHVGPDSIREKLLPQLEDMCRETLHSWSTQTSVEVKQSSARMIFHFFAKHYFGYDAEKLPETERISEFFTNFAEGLMAVPINIPGTTYHRCLKEAKKAFKLIKNILEERRKSPEKYRGDFIDQAINDMKTEEIMTDDQIVYLVAGIWLATWVTNSTLLALIFNFFAEHPSVIEELRVEHEDILRSRDGSSSSLTWNEYKSMKFTQQVINEALRFSILVPGLLRNVLKDIHVKEYTIPAGWFILAVTPLLHMNSEIYKDPLTFNPWRWKDIDSSTMSKNFKPFGGGSRQCPGAEITRAFMATFLHVLVTKYRWTKVKVGRLVRNPILGFGSGVHIKIWEKHNQNESRKYMHGYQ